MTINKFRGIVLLENNNDVIWHYGFLTSLSFINCGKKEKEVIYNSIGQFTNINDKNLVEVFSGDILKETLNNGEERFFKIWVEKGGFVINQFQDDFYKPEREIQFWNGISDMQTASWIESCLEVIGNVHENPELLK